MRFIANGGTNVKYLSVVIFFAILAGVSILLCWQYTDENITGQFKGYPAKPSKDYTASRKDENAEAGQTKKEIQETSEKEISNDGRIIHGNDGIESFVPGGWKITAKADGELNDDGLPDTVLIIQDGESRHLIVLFGNKGKKYDLAVKADRALKPVSYLNDEWQERLEDASIDEGILSISEYWYNPVGGYSGGEVYGFSFREGDLYLTQAHSDYGNAGTGEEKMTDYDFANGKVREKKQRDYSSQSEEHWYEFPKSPLLKLKDFDSGNYRLPEYESFATPEG